MAILLSAVALLITLRLWHASSVPGVASLSELCSLASSLGREVAVGTKNGVVQRILLSPADTGETRVLEELVAADNDGDDGARSSLPIYSMATDDTASSLFCGGGDRYVSVWQKTASRGWKLHQRLGPHTGWVKDVLFQNNRRLFSIGCNCIETWELSDDHKQWSHLCKSSIESSLTAGATLSSDLLCLAALQDGKLVAGGVDGRIHLWNSDGIMGDPLVSVAAHSGRVNALVVDNRTKLLFSGSHDGTVKSWSWSQTLSPVAELQLGGNVRVTALACIPGMSDEETLCRLAIGTNKGLVYLASMDLRREKSPRFELVEETEIGSEPVVINALCVLSSFPDSSSATILVGHSLGMTSILYQP